MKKHKVLEHKNLPTKSPFLGAIVVWLLLDRLKSPSWVYGVCFTLIAIVVISYIISIFTEESTDIFKQEN